MRAVDRLLVSVGQTGADDSNDVLFSFGVDDHDESTPDWAYCNEAIFKVRMLAVEDLQVVVLRPKKPTCFFK